MEVTNMKYLHTRTRFADSKEMNRVLDLIPQLLTWFSLVLHTLYSLSSYHTQATEQVLYDLFSIKVSSVHVN